MRKVYPLARALALRPFPYGYVAVDMNVTLFQSTPSSEELGDV
jgi:hypothetical protein